MLLFEKNSSGVEVTYHVINYVGLVFVNDMTEVENIEILKCCLHVLVD